MESQQKQILAEVRRKKKSGAMKSQKKQVIKKVRKEQRNWGAIIKASNIFEFLEMFTRFDLTSPQRKV